MKNNIKHRTIRLILLFLVSAMIAAPVSAQSVDYAGEPRTIPLWVNGAPGARGEADADRPTLTVYAPFVRSRGPDTVDTAVIVAPGGSYAHLAANHEGRQVANWLNALGVTAFVLKYRVGPRYHHPIELGDAQRAIRLVRARAAEFFVSPERIGMMGFSAGGHLTATAATHFDAGNPAAADPIDRMSSRPDFIILGYPVISMNAPYVHTTSRSMLLGDHPDAKLLDSLSAELQVTAQTPPAFLFSTSADATVQVENSVLFYQALHKAGVPAELHIFEKGPHGIGLDLQDAVLGEWPTLLANWLRSRGLTK